MHDATVLIIEDEPHIRRLIRRTALLDASRVIEAESARQGIDLGISSEPDVIVLDLGLPDAEGHDVCREFRKWTSAPIIVLTARHADRDKVRLLDLGADDYITKPFSSEEFGARLRVQLRRALGRTSGSTVGVKECAHLTIDVAGYTLRRNDRTPNELVQLTRREWDLFVLLFHNAGRTMTHTALQGNSGTPATAGSTHDVRVHIANLRRKIERNPTQPELIITETGVGYRLECPG